jgi:hypothetical protein
VNRFLAFHSLSPCRKRIKVPVMTHAPASVPWQRA